MAKGGIEEEILELKQSGNGGGKDILVGSPSLIVAAMHLNLVDELQLCVQPIILGKGLPLLKNITDRINLTLFNTKTFSCGAITLNYIPAKK